MSDNSTLFNSILELVANFFRDRKSMGKWFSILVGAPGILILVLKYLPAEVFADFSAKYLNIKTDEYNNRVAFHTYHKDAKIIIKEWNRFGANPADEQKILFNIKQSLFSTLENYRLIEAKLLSGNDKNTYLFHLASLQIISADIKNNSDDAKSALKLLEEIDLKNSLKSDGNYQWAKDGDIAISVKRARLNALGLILHSPGNGNYQIEMEELFKDIGGCDYLVGVRGLSHPKLLNAFDCQQ